MSRLSEVAELVQIARNGDIQALDLHALRHVGFSIEVSGHPALRSIDAPMLVVTGDIAHLNQLLLLENPMLAFFPFDQIVSVESLAVGGGTAPGWIEVIGNHRLAKLDFARLEAVHGLFVIERNETLATIDMPRIGAIDFEIGFNPELSSCSMVAVFAERSIYPPNFTIRNNDDRGLAPESLGETWQALEALRGSECVAGSVAFVDGDQPIPSDEPLGSLRYVSGNFRIDSNPLPEKFVLESLQFVGGEFDLLRGYDAVAVELPRLQRVGALRIRFGPDLERFGAPSLQVVAGDVMITSNYVLSAVDFRALRRIGGDLTVTYNPALSATVAHALELQLDTLGGSLNECGNLSSLNGPC
ncbi:MAG: hypothetical protein HOI34_07785 [Rhodospirillaceae bacterium]|jgi:hypothetical protein|nr:hypothetical protein [Rhodospirillaceae bacterium]MBT6510453.1 hypothetical protein [Rhodospirillaceae bacterium]MBT7612447.1 hypothetical protein [Rhodospirillaceae bacterium]MBT7645816.1 hypothetical protein [Rhodospirillaceae bacterium]